MNALRIKCISVITLILIFLTTTFMVVNPNVNGAVTINSSAKMSVEPNPVGVGQYVVLDPWVQPLPPYPAAFFTGYTITITKPDGTIDTLGPYNSTPGGYYYTLYTPTLAGNYSLKFKYAGDTFGNGSAVYLPSESPTTALVVFDHSIPSWQDNPVPTDYWTRPINGQNRLWAAISGDWLARAYNATFRAFDSVGAFNPYSQAARAPHVMWTTPLAAGGIVGGDLSKQVTYYDGASYETKLTPPIIMNGILYYNYPNSLGAGTSGATASGFVGVDLRTGRQLFWNQNFTINLGMEYDYESFNQGGVVGPYLWQTGSTMRMFDSLTGNLLLSFANATGGTFINGPNGELDEYIMNGRNNWLAMWNSTLAFDNAGIVQTTQPTYTNALAYGEWRPVSGTFDWRKGLQWNVTIPQFSYVDPTGVAGTAYQSLDGISGTVIIAADSSTATKHFEVGYDLNTGGFLWNRTISAAAGVLWRAYGEGISADLSSTTMQWTGYDIRTGNQLWVSDPLDYPWGAFQSANSVIAYGMLYTGGYDGYIHAWNITTGKEVWKFYAGDSGYETPYGTYPMYWGPIVAGGVVYIGNGEHHTPIPQYRGEKLWAVDAFTGKELWDMNGAMMLQAIADGYLVGYNTYDNQLYVIGKGPSATTVSAPQTSITQGSSIIISGTVTDKSSGQPDTPAISDADMGKYMAYLKEQQPLDLTHVNGVPVQLTAHASDGSTISIANVTSDAYGNFYYAWTPPSTGLFRIIASFSGSNSYGSSSAETAALISAAPSPSPSVSSLPTPTPSTSPSTSPSTPPSPGNAGAPYTYVIAAAVIVAIVIISAGVVILRRRKT